MSSADVSSPRRRRLWLWILAAVVLAPFIVIAGAAYNYLTLDRAAATLRRQVAAATGSEWSTKVQLSLGRLSLGMVRTGLGFVHEVREKPEIRLALQAVRSVSVGVYERKSRDAAWRRDTGRLLTETDTVMQRQGWARLVGVAESKEAVLVYVPAKAVEPDRLCLAVVNERELVVVSVRVEPDALVGLIEQQVGDKLDLGRLVKL